MNDPNKRIDVNISSLLSLKAELLRKQEEVSKVKAKQESFVPRKIGKNEKKEINEETPEPTKNYTEIEDSALLEKSRRVLEAKAKFYDKMTATGGKLNSDDNCLVMFNHKKQVLKFPEEHRNSSDESSIEEYNDPPDFKSNNPDEGWVEYTDCLGRSRQCLKKDLDFFKKKDSQLAENIQPRIELNQNAPMWMIDVKGNSGEATPSEIADDRTEMTSMISKHDQMKMGWERKEEENAHKENVHYQDVLFDEARTHGVGYYAFSTDEEERAKQRKALDAMRTKTLDAQKDRESQRSNREKIIAERVKAAKNRQRARLGLPPIEDEPEPEIETFDAKAEEKRKKKEEKQRRKKEREEKRKESERKQHIRPWDKNKTGVRGGSNSTDSSDDDEWRYQAERQPMSQEQWNEKKRDERNPEFAPHPENIPTMRNFHARYDNSVETTFEPSDTNQNQLFFTTKKPDRAKQFVKRNYNAVQNYLDSMEDASAERESNAQDNYAKQRGKGTEIAPPTDYDYYGPPADKRLKQGDKNLENSIEAGLKFLRDRSDKGILPTKSSWTANADY